MTRVIIAEGCREFDGPSGLRHYAGHGTERGYRQGGSFELSDPADVAAAVAIGGAVASLAGAGRRSHGFRCEACGFGSFTRICGKCGAECVRE